MSPAKPGVQPTAREIAHAAVSSARGTPLTAAQRQALVDAFTAAIEARDAAHARELAELRAKVIEEIATLVDKNAADAWDVAKQLDEDDDLEAVEAAEGAALGLRGLAARIRALGGKVEP